MSMSSCLIAIAFGLLIAAPACPAADPPLPAAPEKDSRTADNGCTVERYTIASESMGRNIRIAVVLPPGYAAAPDKRYPVIYTLHGMNAPFDTFANMTALQAELADKPMIFTCLDGDKAGWYIDATEKPDSKFETFFFEEFMPAIDARYRTDGRRGITGFSMGGFGAMYYTLKRPDLFEAVCTLSAGFHEFSRDAGRLEETLAPLIGPFKDHGEAYRAMDVFRLLADAVTAGKTLPKIMVRCGTEDFLLEDNRRFVKAMIEANAEITRRRQELRADFADAEQARAGLDKPPVGKPLDFSYIEQPGAHNWAYWHAQAPEFVRFFWEVFENRQASSP